ncbi:MAG: hypothetical protein CBC42_02485 [Betaproteobacteria bacterium TMED82]|nr:MAG: hypothetical protein CBC42_02485 [Betaproteobacteria bacterium TMED82]
MFRHGYYCIFLICFLCINSCSPTFNWREVYGLQDEWRALLPGKPFKEKRVLTLQIDNESHRVEISRHTCEINQTIFLVESAKLINPQSNLSPKKLKDFLEERLLVKFKGVQVKNKKNAQLYRGAFNSFNKAQPKEMILAFKYKIKTEYVLSAIVLADSLSFDEEKSFFFLNSLE